MKIFNPMKLSCLCAMAILTLSLTGCSKDNLDDIGSGTATLEISAAIQTGAQAKTLPQENKFAGNLNFTSGFIWVSAIEFDGTLDRGTSIERRVERFSKIDFMTGSGVPPIDDVSIPAGSYTYVNIEVELRDEDTQPAIVMEGTYMRTDGSQAPIRFEFNSGETFEAETDQMITVEEGTTVLGEIVIDPYTWFATVPVEMLDNATVNANGIILIADDFNEDLFDLVADGLDTSTESEFSN